MSRRKIIDDDLNDKIIKLFSIDNLSVKKIALEVDLNEHIIDDVILKYYNDKFNKNTTSIQYIREILNKSSNKLDDISSYHEELNYLITKNFKKRNNKLLK